MIQSVDSTTGHKYLGMLFFPTNDLNDIILKNINKRMVNVSKYYAWLVVNEETPVDIKLLVLDQCMFTSLLYGIEAWDDISIIENKILKIELDALRRILKVKTGTSIDLIYFELNMRDAQFKIHKKLSAITHDVAIVKNVVGMFTGDDMIKYNNHLQGHHQEDNLCKRRNTIMNCESSMITYYRNVISPVKSCIYNYFLHDYFRFIITRWRLSNHKLKIEVGRYPKPLTPRNESLCDYCELLEDEFHAIFVCPKFAAIRNEKYTNS